jgi:hypothetical protein
MQIGWTSDWLWSLPHIVFTMILPGGDPACVRGRLVEIGPSPGAVET